MMIDRIFVRACLVTAAIALWAPAPSKAQALCAEGRMTNGQCVDAALASAARQSSIIFSQSRISYTAYPVLPTGDRAYRYPNQLNGSPQTVTPLGPFRLGPGAQIIIVR